MVSKVQNSSSPLEYMRQLDGLRAIAVTGAIVQHYSWGRIPLVFPWGILGTRLFFVLSGFLITGILMKSRAEVRQGQPVFLAIRQFYGRRFLRILPIYYGVLFAFWLGSHEFRLSHEISWFLVFAQNIKFAIAGEYTFATHLWTLAVEEQFYLFFPLLFVLVPRRWSLQLFIAIIAASMLFQLKWAPSVASAKYHTISACSQLGVGCILALFISSGTIDFRKLAVLPRSASLAPYCLLILAIFLPGKIAGAEPSLTLAFAVAEPFIFAAIILDQAFCPNSTFRTSKIPFLNSVGKWTYGLYAYHMIVVIPISWAFGTRAGATSLGCFGFSAYVLVVCILTLLISYLSYRWVERPILAGRFGAA